MRKSAKRGSVLATVLLLTMLLAIVTAVVANNTLQNYKTTNWASGAGTSRYIAYAGIQHAMIKLRNDPTYSDTFEGVVPGREEFKYRVTVKNQRKLGAASQGSTSGTGSLRFNLKEIPAYCAKIESKVLVNDGKLDAKVERTLSGMIGTAMFKPTNFKNAASAKSTILMTGASKTRAYDFWLYKDGARESASTNSWDGYVLPPGVTEDKKEEDKEDKDDKKDDYTMVKGTADVTTSHLMQIGDTSKVEGDVIMPPVQTETTSGGLTGTTTTTTTTSPLAGLQESLEEIAPELARAMAGVGTEPKKDVNFTGAMKIPEIGASAPVAAPPYDRAEAKLELSNFPSVEKKDQWGYKYWDSASLPPMAYKSITVPNGQTLKLTPGRYYISDTFQVDGEIVVDGGSRGDVIVYVGKSMVVNGRVNFQGDPASMQVYFTDEDHKKDASGADILVDGKGNKLAGFSNLKLGPDSKSTMVAQGTNLIATLDKARLLGSVSGDAVWMKNGAAIEYDTNLADRQMAGASPWKLQGVYETVGR